MIPARSPRSLQRLMSDATQSLANWDDDSESDEEAKINAETRDWLLKLSRGECDERTLLECVAEDCEEVGDWVGAERAYQQIIEKRQDSFHASSAHQAIATIRSLLGDHKPALAHFQAATRLQRPDELGGIMFRSFLVCEAGCLVQMGRIRYARRRLREGFNSISRDSSDLLAYARLCTIWADCDLVERRSESALAYLQAADNALVDEAHGRANAGYEGETPAGVASTRSAWWRVEGRRQSLVGAGEAEVEAYRQALTYSRQAACGWERLAWEGAVMRDAYRFANACRRHGRMEEAQVAEAEAEQFRLKWRLPPQAVDPSTTGARRSFLHHCKALVWWRS